jgi:hypothetical protein
VFDHFVIMSVRTRFKNNSNNPNNQNYWGLVVQKGPGEPSGNIAPTNQKHAGHKAWYTVEAPKTDGNPQRLPGVVQRGIKYNSSGRFIPKTKPGKIQKSYAQENEVAADMAINRPQYGGGDGGNRYEQSFYGGGDVKEEPSSFSGTNIKQENLNLDRVPTSNPAGSLQTEERFPTDPIDQMANDFVVVRNPGISDFVPPTLLPTEAAPAQEEDWDNLIPVEYEFAQPTATGVIDFVPRPINVVQPPRQVQSIRPPPSDIPTPIDLPQDIAPPRLPPPQLPPQLPAPPPIPALPPPVQRPQIEPPPPSQELVPAGPGGGGGGSFINDVFDFIKVLFPLKAEEPNLNPGPFQSINYQPTEAPVAGLLPPAAKPPTSTVEITDITNVPAIEPAPDSTALVPSAQVGDIPANFTENQVKQLFELFQSQGRQDLLIQLSQIYPQWVHMHNEEPQSFGPTLPTSSGATNSVVRPNKRPAELGPKPFRDQELHWLETLYNMATSSKSTSKPKPKTDLPPSRGPLSATTTSSSLGKRKPKKQGGGVSKRPKKKAVVEPTSSNNVGVKGQTMPTKKTPTTAGPIRKQPARAAKTAAQEKITKKPKKTVKTKTPVSESTSTPAGASGETTAAPRRGPPRKAKNKKAVS